MRVPAGPEETAPSRAPAQSGLTGLGPAGADEVGVGLGERENEKESSERWYSFLLLERFPGPVTFAFWS